MSKNISAKRYLCHLPSLEIFNAGYLRVVLTVGYFFLLTPIYGQESVIQSPYAEGATGLDLQFTQNEKTAASPELAEQQLKACRGFSRYFRRNAGLWATGPFLEVSCHNDKAAAKVKRQTPSKWVLKMSSSKDGAVFEIFFHASPDSFLSASKLIIPSIPDPLIAIQDKKLTQLIAAQLSMALPMRSILASSRLKVGQTLTGQNLSLGEIEPPETLAIFEWQEVRGALRPVVLGAMKLKNKDSKKVSWTTDKVIGVPNGKFVFIQQTDDRTQLLTVMGERINSSSETFLSKLFSTGRSAYVGLRYGAPLSGGAGPLSKAPLYGFLGEFRSGILSGFKINYDVVPKRAVTTESVSESFESSRVQIGYSLGTRLPIPIINWIDITPRLGVTNLDYTVKALDDANEDGTASFNQRRAPTTGLELGLENRDTSFLLRAWGFINYSVGIVDLDKNTSTNSFRVGLDVFKDLVTIGSLRLAVLGFAAYDSTKISKEQDEQSDDTTSIEAIKFDVSYLGGGVALTW